MDFDLMKKLFLSLLLLCGQAFAGPNDFIFMQRNALDTGNVQRVLASPTTTGFFTYNATTKLGGYTTLGSGLSLANGVLSATTTIGPQGPAGADGAAGATGPVGATGATGAPGVAGAAGVNGTNGAKGDKGDKGEPGTAGTTDWFGITNKPTTLAGFGITDAYPLISNPAGYLTGITQAQVTSALGITPVSQAGARSSISLTTTGTGAATYNASTGVLNVPTPAVSNAPTINRTRATTAADGTYVWTLPVPCAAGTVPIVSVTPESTTANDAVSHRLTAIPTNTTVSVFAGRSPGLTVLGLTVLGIPTGAAIPLHLIAVCP